MCFAEYLGYVCGHTSIAVNRPCPMTTHLFNNPCCPQPATRPYLTGTMCYPCNRIIHGRRIDIAEFEHRWMHERGACSCDVKFPAMQEPKLVQRTWRADEGETGATVGAGVGTSAAGAGSYMQHVPPPVPSWQPMQPNTAGRGEGTNLPLFEEAQVGGNVEVSVRLPSIWGAEWTQDHAKLHESGECSCYVSFERYKPIDINEDQEEAGGAKSDPACNPQDYMSGRTPTGHVARWATNGPPNSLLDDILGPIQEDQTAYGGRPVDVQTMHFQPRGPPIVGYPIASGPTPESSGLPTIVEFSQPDTTLGGFPIGAGPEGESHAGDFETCSLNLEDFQNSRASRRRRSSSSF
ncbi:hypothetical protein F5Y10DRAFT_264680 [Nemania abortiva]|nr:hypothetical protein F5Y10DRAFT_264680 [Nemania abortiva]